MSFEALEPRFLLSADLVGDVSAILLQDQFLPSDDLTVPVVVHDIGSDPSEPIPAVRLYDSVAIGKSLSVAWSFGEMPGNSNSDSITLTDPAGTRVTFKLSGPGQGNVVLNGDAFNVHLTGTDSTSTLKITTSGGLGYTTVNDLLVEGSLNAIQASNVNLDGTLDLGGTVRSLELRNLGNDADVSIAGSEVPVNLVAGSVAGADIVSASPFESISIRDWLDAATGSGAIQAPSIGTLVVAGEFSGDLQLSGAAAGLTLGSAQIGGRISADLWNVSGSAGSIVAGSIDASWQGSFTDSLQKITTNGDMSGVLAAPIIGSIQVGGDMIDARVLAGADLGSDGLLGGSGDAADRFVQSELKQLRVDQSIRDSTILVGVDPMDAIYSNGNDVIIGGQASRIQHLTTNGALLGTTEIVAGAFPKMVKINGANVNPASVPQLHTIVPDTVAPQITLGLFNDTGASAGDGVTWDPTLAGSVVEAGSIVSLLFAIDDFSPEIPTDIQSYRQPDGSLVLDEVLFASMLGGPLADGAHSVQLKATDAAGNASVRTFTFVLDRTVPAFVSFDLAPESDHGFPGDRMTNSPTVALDGLAEPQVAFAIDGTDVADLTNLDGTFRVENVALTEGDNHFTVRFTDLAGNQTVYLQTIRLESTAPSLQLALVNDTGTSPSDAVTSDPAITAFASDSGLLTSWSVGIDGSNYSELLINPAPRVSFPLSAGFLDQVSGGVLGDGTHTLQFTVYDTAGNATTEELQFFLDRTPPLSPQFGLAAGSDTGVQGDQRTREAVVTLQGVTEANAALSLLGTGLNTVSDGSGLFSFRDVALAEGQNVLFVQALDAAGNASLAANVLYGDSTAPELSVGLANDTGPSNSDGQTRDPSLGGLLADIGSVVSMTVSIDGGPTVEYQGAPTTSIGFYIDGAVLDGQAGGFLLDGPHTYSVRATDAAGNLTIADLDFVLDRSVPAPPQFDLALASDSGVPGDQHTSDEMVSLTGFADFEIDLMLNDAPVSVVWNGNHFRIDGVLLALGENVLTLRATDLAGNQSEFTRGIFRDGVPVDDGLFPDLVVNGIRTAVVGTDEVGNTLLQVTWTTSNEGSATAQGRHGAWAEGVYLSPDDDTPWGPNDIWLGNIKISGPLDAGESEVHSMTVLVPSWVPTGYRIYVVTDSEEYILNPDLIYEFFANEVAEKTAGEYNDLAIQDVASGLPPLPIAPAPDGDLPLDGTAVGGLLGAGDSSVYSFSLGTQTFLYFDALSADAGLTWTLGTTAGDAVYSRAFAASDAFGIGTANPLLNLEAGSYELVINNTAGDPADYGFRLLDPDVAAYQDYLNLDGGPVSREKLEHGNWTDIYQFEATAGTHYVAGGPNDWAVDGALYWRLFDPNGNQVWTGTTSPSDEDVFDLTGTYTLMVEGRVGRTDAQQYSAYVFTPQDREFDLAPGSSLIGFLDSPGQVNTYDFTLDQATAAFFDGKLESNGPYFQWTLDNAGGIVASGMTRQDTTDAMGIAEPLRLDAGTYSLRIEGLDNAAGWYRFQLFDLLNDPAQSLVYDEPATGFLSPGWHSTLYRFDGAAGEALTIQLNPWDDGQILFDPLQWLLVDDAGAVVAKGQSGARVDTLLGDTGSYSLLIQGFQYNWSTAFYSLTVTETAAT